MGERHRYAADASCPFDGHATGAYAALTAVGTNHIGTATQIEDWLRRQYAYLMNHPDSTAIASGGLRLAREYDGDTFVGITLYLDLGTVWADDLPKGAADAAR